MPRRIRAAGWGLLALAVVVLAAVVITGAIRAHGNAAFNRWVGWATVAAVPIAALGIVLVVVDKITQSLGAVEPDIRKTEDELAAVVLAQTQVARSRLIGAGEPGDLAANLRFVKGGGRFREVGGTIGGDLASVLEYYQSLSPGRLMVLGEPGAGKTVLVMELVIRLLEARLHDTGMPVPVLISAAAYESRLEWGNWLAQHLAERFSIGDEAAARLVRDGRILPVVDGVDEMDRAGESQRARVLVAALNASMHGRERAPVVVTCRRSEYRVLTREVDRATHIEIVPLTGDEAAVYLWDQFRDQDERQRWEPVLASLHADPAGPLATQLATPWRLTLALAAFRDAGDPSGLLPAAPGLTGKAAQEYAQRIDGVLLGRYVSAAVRLHDPSGRYTERHIQRWLVALADGLAWQSRHRRSATDIQLDQWWRPRQRTIRLSHVAVAAVPGLICLIASAVTADLAFVPAGGGCLLVAALASISLPQRQLKGRQMATLRGLGRLAVGLSLGLATAVTVGGTGHLEVGLTLGLASGLMVGLLGGLHGSSPHAFGPRDLLRADCGRGIAAGLAVGLAVGLASGLVYGPVCGLACGSASGLAYGLALGAKAWTRYHVNVVVMAVRQQGPLRFSAFLDWAYRAGLLRVSGIAYQFRHRQLQDWLTSRQSER